MAGYPAGHIVTADELHDGDTWTDFSSTFTWGVVSGTAPTKGSSVYSARTVLLSAHVAMDVVKIQVGSGFSAGSGTYMFSLGHTPADTEGYGAMGSAHFLHSLSEFVGFARITTGKAVLYVPSQTGTTTSGTPVGGSQVTNSKPAAWGSGDMIRYSIVYEV